MALWDCPAMNRRTIDVAIDTPAIRERVPCSNLRYGEGDEYLW